MEVITMKNAEALVEIRKGIQEEIDKNGWSFILRPRTVGKECVTWVQAKDVTNAPVSQSSCQLIEGGGTIHPDNEGELENVSERIQEAIKRLHAYVESINLTNTSTRTITDPDPIKELIERYKVYLTETKLEDELYKWELIGKFKGRPDLNAADFYQEIKSINYSNLIYKMGLAVMYHIAQERPDQYRTCFKILFDENVPLATRLNTFNTETLKLYRELESKLPHHHDERTMATLLAYKYPEKYPLYKNSFYKKFCKLKGIPAKKSGEKYVHYLELVEQFINDYIIPDTELIYAVNEILPETVFKDPTYRILAQDILYKMLDGKSLTEDTADEDEDEEVALNDTTYTVIHPLNQILYGPPGTGKTYSTKQLAVQIIENLSEKELLAKYPDRQAITSRFNIFQDRKQVEFITFHQSFAYEDFIEGIKPMLPKASGNEEIKEADGGRLAYEIADGIFKTICERAESYLNYTPEKASDDFKNLISQNFETADFYKMSIGNTALPEDEQIFQYCLDNEVIALGWGGDINFQNVKERKEIKTKLQEEGEERSSYETTAVKTFVLDLKKGDYVFVSSGNYKIRAIAQVIGDYYFLNESPIPYSQFRKVRWIAKDMVLPVTELYEKSFSMQTIYGLNKSLIKKEYFQSSISQSKVDEFRRDHVLIIDEINRGNVSQIFGELITLIEADKRTGNSESLKIKLPYSKEDFSVPKNLFIIGTMNTADRSVEALDTALRRRFSFLEMPPMYAFPELQKEILGYRLADILQKINLRIEKLLSKDNLIGHSYFLSVEAETDLRAAFQNKIIPLLQEYFYGDFGKIGLVLGNGFVKTTSSENDNVFAKFGDYDASGLAEKEVYHLVNVLDENEMPADAFKAALEALM